jgi:hypothetical protein
MPTVYGIIGRGYLPKELPPGFTSKVCASVLGKNMSTIPSAFTQTDRVSMNANHNLLSRGSLRRQLGIPNPTNFFRLARFVVANWNMLTSITGSSDISMTSPIGERHPRAIGSEFSFVERDNRRVHLRGQSRYVLRADISQLYHSIYTHSISWAIHGKVNAKAKRNDRTLKGNILDRLVRNSQEGQSIGIPIGPDTSFLIAEIILSVNDIALSGKGVKNAFRAIDDYEFGCDSLNEAESRREELQEVLNEYQLVLNADKTYVTELPVPIESLAISELRRYVFSSRNRGTQRNQIIHYFDQAFVFSKEYPEDAILKYAISRLSGVLVIRENREICEDLLMQCVIVDPSVIEKALNQLLRYKDMGYSLDLDHIGEVFNKVISKHARLGHSSEVAWALWGLIVLGLQISDSSAAEAARMSDSIVAILMLDARAKGFVSSSVDLSHFESYMNGKDLYGEQWLLAYEANVKNWLPWTSKRDYVQQDTYFGFLKNRGVYFYDDRVSGRMVYKAPKLPAVGEEY